MQNNATAMSQIVEHTEIDEHLEEIAKNVMAEHQFYTKSIYLGIFSIALIVKLVWLLGSPDY